MVFGRFAFDRYGGRAGFALLSLLWFGAVLPADEPASVAGPSPPTTSTPAAPLDTPATPAPSIRADSPAPAQAPTAGSEAGGELRPASLVAMWRSLETDIASADITYRKFLNRLYGGRTSQQVAEAVAKYDMGSDIEQFRQFVVELNGGPIHADPPWTMHRLLASGPQVRDTSEYGDFLRDDELLLHWEEANEQVTVYEAAAARMGHDELATFRTVPPATLLPEHLEFAGSDGANLRFVLRAPGPDGRTTAGRDQLAVDGTSGVVTYFSSHDAEGVLRQERWLLGLAEHPGGIVFPRATLHVRYNTQGQADQLIALLVETSQFNEPLEPGAFVLPAEKEVTLVDHRSGVKTVYGLPEATDDLREYLRRAPTPVLRGGPSPERPGSRSFLLVINGLVLMTAGVALWKRMGRSTRGSAPAPGAAPRARE